MAYPPGFTSTGTPIKGYGYPISVYGLDSLGVVVDTNPIAAPLGAWTKTQNGTIDPLGEVGSVRKRPGLKPLNGTAVTGPILGGVGIPLFVGSAGPVITNPFQDTPVTLTALQSVLLPNVTEPIFDDLSNLITFPFEGEVQQLDNVPDVFDVQDDAVINPIKSALLPLTWMSIGDRTATSGSDYTQISMQIDLSDETDSHVTPSLASFLAYPTSNIRNDFSPGSTDPMYNWYHSANYISSPTFLGKPYCVLGDKLYYAAGPYTVGTQNPTIRVYDGKTDSLLCQVPINPDVGTPTLAVVTMIGANNHVYFSTMDGGTASANTIQGAVYELNVITGVVSKCGATLPTGFIAYSLAFMNNLLFAGVSANKTGAAAKLYYVQPPSVYPSQAWIVANTFSTDEHIITCMYPFFGTLFVGVSRSTTPGVVVYTTGAGSGYLSLTGDVSFSGGAAVDMVVWPPENSGYGSPVPNLYFLYSGNSDGSSTNTLKSRITPGGGWNSNPLTFTSSGNPAYHLNIGNGYVSGVTKPIIWVSGGNSTAALFTSSNGTSFTDRTSAISSNIYPINVFSLLVQI